MEVFQATGNYSDAIGIAFATQIGIADDPDLIKSSQGKAPYGRNFQPAVFG